MNRPQKAAALALAITSAWLGVAGSDDLTGVYRSSRWRVVMEAPTDYRRAGESPFPGVLARFAHSSGSTLTLSATTLPKRRKAVTSPCGDDTLGAFATENVRVILAHGYVLAQNVEALTKLVADLKRVRPDILIVLGGPEVSYETEEQPIVQLADYVITGEGDHEFRDLCRTLLAGTKPTAKVLHAAVPELPGIQLPYNEYSDEDIQNRVIYVEASRGCPFTCEFCLSALEIPVRQFPLDEFLPQMQGLLDRGVRQFRFVDRTFNLNLRVSLAILEFFLERISAGLFLHFELIPDRLPDPLRTLIAPHASATTALIRPSDRTPFTMAKPIKPIRKAVFPVAGLGTRFLPATTAMPKEMLTEVDRPVIQHVVDEAREAGIEHFIFVTGRNKGVIEDHFDSQFELERTLMERGKKRELEMITRDLPGAGQTSFTRQQAPLGLGHAVWCARDIVGNEPFALLLPDMLHHASTPCMADMMKAYMERGGNAVAVSLGRFAGRWAEAVRDQDDTSGHFEAAVYRPGCRKIAKTSRTDSMSPFHSTWPLPPPTPSLGPDELHVWVANQNRPQPQVDQVWLYLGDEEGARAKRFYFDHDRKHYIVARGLLRLLLGRYLHLPPTEVAFVYGEHGKPDLAPAQAQVGVRFNISHSHGVALLAFAREREVGVDIEQVRPLGRRANFIQHWYARSSGTGLFSPAQTSAALPQLLRQIPGDVGRLWIRIHQG